MTTKKTPEAPKKPEVLKAREVFYRPSCTLVIGERSYTHGDPVDDWDEVTRERFKFDIRKVPAE